MKRGRQSVNARRAQMLAMIRERQTIKVEELAGIFNVSLMTVRRDLQALEDSGQIGRFYGGAAVDPDAVADAGPDDVALCRRLIARYAASLVWDGDYVFINGSGTALKLLDYVGEKTVHVFTNNGAAVGGALPPGVEVTLSGGSLRERLGECMRRFGQGRVSLDLQRLRMSFPLPCPTGEGEPLDRQSFEKMLEQKRQSVFYSNDLCAKYFTFTDNGNSRFVLFDDADTMRRKLRLGQELGIGTGFLMYPETEDLLPELLGQRRRGMT